MSNFIRIDTSKTNFETDDKDLIKIRFQNDDIVHVNFSKFFIQSKYIQDKYKYSEALKSIQTEIDSIKEEMKIDEECIKYFIQLIQQEKVMIPIEHYKDFYLLSEFFGIQKFTQELDNISQQGLFADLNFTIQILINSKTASNDFETILTSKIEYYLASHINECFENPKFDKLPISILYRIIELSNKESINADLLVDFILKSADTRFILLKFIEFSKLSENKVKEFFNFIDEQKEGVNIEYMTFNYLFIKQIMSKFDETKKELNQTKDELNQTKDELNQTKDELNQTKDELNQMIEKFGFANEELNQTIEKLKQTEDELNQTKNKMNQYIIVGGYDKYKQLGEEPNNTSENNSPIINPPLKSSIDPSSLLSYSVYSWHSVIVTNNGSLLGIGSNNGCRITSSLEKTGERHFTISIKDNRGNKLDPVSAVCGQYGTLYMISKGDKKQLVLCNGYINNGDPVFLNIGNKQPVALFGGSDHAASISSEGEVIFINRFSIKKSPNSSIEAVALPGNEKASFVACCDSLFVALSTNGRVFSYVFEDKNSYLRFQEVEELEGHKIVWVSGTYDHFFAVSKEGRVFGRGSNKYGKLGLGQTIESVQLFTEISAISKYKIRSAYAGHSHSLFVTREGKILSCGLNSHGELLLDKNAKRSVYTPVETTITGGATFCIAGIYLSSVFIGIEPPPNTPNKRIQPQ